MCGVPHINFHENRSNGIEHKAKKVNLFQSEMPLFTDRSITK